MRHARAHTVVTATRAVDGPVRLDGNVHETRLADLAQHALDDVRRRVELQGHTLDPGAVVVDVRVTAFVPYVLTDQEDPAP